jgi:hypothetical protein
LFVRDESSEIVSIREIPRSIDKPLWSNVPLDGRTAVARKPRRFAEIPTVICERRDEESLARVAGRDRVLRPDLAIVDSAICDTSNDIEGCS